MIAWIIAAGIVGATVVSLVIDVGRGTTYASNFQSGRGAWIRRDTHPRIFFCILGVKALASLLVAALITGWFQRWIEWSI